MTQPVSLLTAFLGGVMSFVSPCVLPIVPGYLSFISGVNVAQFKGKQVPPGLVRRVTITSLCFVLGFSVVFVTLGAVASYAGYLLKRYQRELSVIGGVLVLILGLHTAGILRIPFLLYQKRAEVRERPLGLFGAFVVGLAFGFGWTPCIGPILGAILLYAAQQDTLGQGVALLAAYSAGLGIPFVLSGLAINQFFAASARMRRHMDAVERVSGVLLILVGLLLITGRLEALARFFSRLFPSLGMVG